MASEPAASSGSNVPNETILYYTHELSRSKRRVDEASSAHRLIVKRAKSDGCPTDAILESIALARLPPEERRQRIIDRIKVEAARYPQQGAQIADALNHLDTHVSDGMRQTTMLFDAEARGYQAGKFGVPAEDNPYEAGSEQHQTWRRYWADGKAATEAALGPNTRMASAKRDGPPPARAGRKRAATPPPTLPLEQRKGRPRGRRGRSNGQNASA